MSLADLSAYVHRFVRDTDWSFASHAAELNLVTDEVMDAALVLLFRTSTC